MSSIIKRDWALADVYRGSVTAGNPIVFGPNVGDLFRSEVRVKGAGPNGDDLVAYADILVSSDCVVLSGTPSQTISETEIIPLQTALDLAGS